MDKSNRVEDVLAELTKLVSDTASEWADPAGYVGFLTSEVKEAYDRDGVDPTAS